MSNKRKVEALQSLLQKVQLVISDEQQVLRLEKTDGNRSMPLWKISFDDVGTLHITCTDVARELVVLPCTGNKIELRVQKLGSGK